MNGGAPAAFDRRAVVAWCLYDWANSAFPTVITTFLFSAYVATAVAPDTVSGTARWGEAMSLAGILIALAGPPLGAIADRGGRRKPWIAALSALSIVATAAMWFVHPDPSDLGLALALAIVATIGFELATVFYNAMLPGLAPRSHLGRVSGLAWGVGYAGGLACLMLVLFLLLRPAVPPFGLDEAAAEPVRAGALVAALWFTVFAVPLFFMVPEQGGERARPLAAVRGGLVDLVRTLRGLRAHANVARFLLAKMIYMDGLNALFAFGGIYAAGTFAMSLEEVLLFGILVNVTSGLGAAAFAWVDDWIGARLTILIALGALTLVAALTATVVDKTAFYALTMLLGCFFGPVQAASRSLMARLAPRGREAEFFGLYSLAGKATAFLGPVVVAWVTEAWASQRLGIASLLVFFVAGFLLMLQVKEPARA